MFRINSRWLFAVIWVAAICLAVGQHGVAPLLSFGASASWLSVALIVNPRRVTGILKRKYRFLCVVGFLIASMVFVFVTVRRFGKPLDAPTWLCLFSPPLLIVAVGGTVKNAKALVLVLAILACQLWIWRFGEQAVTFDIANAAEGSLVWPCLRFAREGPNSQIICRYVGRRKPVWRVCGLDRYGYVGDIADGTIKADRVSIVFEPFLPRVLYMLPTEQARKQILGCLTDQQNLARAHQSLLLTCLYVRGFPEGFDSRSWWEHHKAFFVSTHDPDEAALFVWGVRKRVSDCGLTNYQNGQPIEAHQLVLSAFWAADAIERESRTGLPRALMLLDDSPLYALLGRYDDVQDRLAINKIAWWRNDQSVSEPKARKPTMRSNGR